MACSGSYQRVERSVREEIDRVVRCPICKAELGCRSSAGGLGAVPKHNEKIRVAVRFHVTGLTWDGQVIDMIVKADNASLADMVVRMRLQSAGKGAHNLDITRA